MRDNVRYAMLRRRHRGSPRPAIPEAILLGLADTPMPASMPLRPAARAAALAV